MGTGCLFQFTYCVIGGCAHAIYNPQVTTISDMASTVVGIYCGTTPPPPILVATDVLSIQFYSDGSIEGKGFNATYAMLQGIIVTCINENKH